MNASKRAPAVQFDACEVTLENRTGYGVGLRALRPWLEKIVADLAPKADSFAAELTSDRQLRTYNRQFRDKDQSTDVLSFPGEEGPEGWHLGDVAISVPTARRQALQAGHPLARELRVLLLHGVLHCLGYDHETDDGTMEQLESELRTRWLSPSGKGRP